MSSQAQVNSNPNWYILYYANYVNSDATIYDTALGDVCSVSFSGGVLQIAGWQPLSYPQPTNAQLLSYVWITVRTWFQNFYGNPASIVQQQPFLISTSDLS